MFYVSDDSSDTRVVVQLDEEESIVEFIDEVTHMSFITFYAWWEIAKWLTYLSIKTREPCMFEPGHNSF